MVRSLAVITIALLSACTDNPTFSDAGLPPLPDATRSGDASVQICGPDGGCTGPFRVVCDTSVSECAECLTSADCAATGALGPMCDESRGYCQCTTDNDCTGNPNGPLCHPELRACVCAVEAQCSDGLDCAILPYLGGGVRTCQ